MASGILTSILMEVKQNESADRHLDRIMLDHTHVEEEAEHDEVVRVEKGRTDHDHDQANDRGLNQSGSRQVHERHTWMVAVVVEGGEEAEVEVEWHCCGHVDHAYAEVCWEDVVEAWRVGHSSLNVHQTLAAWTRIVHA